MFMTDEFIYSEGIEEIASLTLNMTLHKKSKNKIEGEFRKKFTIDLEEPDFWIELFSNSLEGKDIKAPVLIVFRDKFGSACKLKELGLLKPNTKIKD